MQSHNKGTWGVAILNEASYYEEDLTPHITIERGGVGLVKYVTCFSANMELWETFCRVHSTNTLEGKVMSILNVRNIEKGISGYLRIFFHAHQTAI